MKTKSKVLIGLTVAAAAGAAIGMLLAPEKGAELQRKLRVNAKDWFKDFSSLLNTIKDVAGTFQSNAQDHLEEAKDAVLERANKV